MLYLLDGLAVHLGIDVKAGPTSHLSWHHSCFCDGPVKLLQLHVSMASSNAMTKALEPGDLASLSSPAAEAHSSQLTARNRRAWSSGMTHHKAS